MVTSKSKKRSFLKPKWDRRYGEQPPPTLNQRVVLAVRQARRAA